MDKKNKFLSSFAISAIVAVVFVAFATIFGELYKPFKDWLKEVFSHHWIGKGVLSTLILYILGVILTPFFRDKESVTVYLIWTLFWITVVASLSIGIFYVYETFFVQH